MATSESESFPEPNPRSDHGESRTPTRISRRGAVGLAAAGLGAVAGFGAGTALGDTAGATTQNLVVDVALRGETFRFLFLPELLGQDSGLDPADLRGSPFWTEGWVYPEGTIQGSGFVPTEEGAIGHWICRGNLISSPSRPEPHIISNQEFILGLIGGDQVFPPDMIATVGLEAPNDPVHQSMRAVTGGTGRYRGATGQVLETEIGENSTIQYGTDLPAPSLRFEFDLTIPTL